MRATPFRVCEHALVTFARPGFDKSLGPPLRRRGEDYTIIQVCIFLLDHQVSSSDRSHLLASNWALSLGLGLSYLLSCLSCSFHLD
jgi:hypothetical protein